MSLLSIVQDACLELTIATPSIVIGNGDENIKRLLRAANAEGKHLCTEHGWEALETEATFTSVATASQGAISTIAPGYKKITNNTAWNRSTDNLIAGPVSAQEWQLRQATSPIGPYYKFRIRNGNLYLTPTPTAGETIAFEYITKNWVQNAAGSSSYETFQADTDVPVFDEELVTLGVIWRFNESRGFDFTANLAMYNRRLDLMKQADGGKRTYYMDEPRDVLSIPGAVVPEGSWPL